MKHARLDLARSADLLPPLTGSLAVFGQMDAARLVGLTDLEIKCESNSFATNAALRASGFDVAPTQSGSFDNAVVFLPRAKAEALDLIAKAIKRAGDGWIIVDGQKTDGIESIAKLIARDVAIAGSYSKGHGKAIWFRASEAKALTAWHSEARHIDGGFLTAPGVFSADSVDPASAMLLDHIPAGLKGEVVDLGAGWGFLSAGVLAQSPDIKALHLVEDNAAALECARSNVPDPRAVFHWADALRWKPDAPVQTVIMNPPFHTSRNADPKLGVAFIEAAARMLKPMGKLYMVANAHLPYEPVLEHAFAKVDLIERSTKFKVFCAERGRAKV